MQRGKFIVDNDKMQSGVWECTPGHFDVKNRVNAETCYIISGKARLTSLDDPNSFTDLGPGDGFILPLGSSNRWDIIEKTRKFFTIMK